MAIDYMSYVTPYTGDPNKQFQLQKKIAFDRARAESARNAVARKQMSQQKAQHAAALEESNRAAVARETGAQDRLKFDQTVLRYEQKAKNDKAIAAGMKALGEEQPDVAAGIFKSIGATEQVTPAPDFAVEDVVVEGAAPTVDAALQSIGIGGQELGQFLAEEKGLRDEMAGRPSAPAGKVAGFSGIEDWAKAPGARPAPVTETDVLERQRQDQRDAEIQARGTGRTAPVSPYADNIPYRPSGAVPKTISEAMEPTVNMVDAYGTGYGDVMGESRRSIAARKEAAVGHMRSEYNSRVDALKGTEYESLITRLKSGFERIAEVFADNPEKGVEVLIGDYEFQIQQFDKRRNAKTMAGTRGESSRLTALGMDMRNAEQAVDNMEARHKSQGIPDAIKAINSLDDQIAAWMLDKGNEAIQAQLELSFARILQPGGVLTDKDVTRTIGADRKSLVDQVHNFLKVKFDGGTLPEYFQKGIDGIKKLRGRAKQNIRDLRNEDLRTAKKRMSKISPATRGENPWMEERFDAAIQSTYVEAKGWLENIEAATKKKAAKKKDPAKSLAAASEALELLEGM